MRQTHHILQFLRLIGLFALIMLLGQRLVAAPAENDIAKEKAQFIDYMVHHYHCERGLVTQIVNQAQYRDEVLEHIKKPYEQEPWSIYQAHLVTPKRIERGMAFWLNNADTLDFIYHQYRVPSSIIVGILGVETSYGLHLGRYKVMNTLVTLSFYYPPRTRFFKSELAEFILYCQRHHIKPSTVVGSYAGAIGEGQFMPSSINNYAVSAKKQSNPDYIHNEGDAIASVANYLAKHDWRPGQPIVAMITFKDENSLKYNLKHDLGKEKTLKDWYARGVKIMTPLKMNDPYMKARLFTMKGKNGTEYWLAFHNFDVIKTYNASDNYALAVVVLGTTIQNHLVKEFSE